MEPRSIDHVVMPVETLPGARALLEELGFVVAPDARHPFGTGNACVFLRDGTYLEPLAVVDRDLAETEAAGGNAFLRHDLSYRLRHPLPGLSGVALASGDAEADAQAFAEAGLDGGPVLEFGRRFESPDGTSSDLRFRLAFAADHAAPETFLFTCQRLFDFVPDRSALTDHPNGVTGLTRLVYVGDEPATAQALLTRVVGDVMVSNALGTSIAAGNALVDVLTPDGLVARYGIARRETGGLRLAGLVLATSDMAVIRTRTGEMKATSTDLLGRIVVTLSEAGGTFLAFEEAPAG